MTPPTQGTIRWSVAQIWSKRAHRVRKDVQELGHGLCVPTYWRKWFTDGKISERERELFPGYLIFQTPPDGWNGVACTEGVIRVLRSVEGIASPIKPSEMYHLFVGSKTGAFNEVDIAPVNERKPRVRRRRPRPGKRGRMAKQREVRAGL